MQDNSGREPRARLRSLISRSLSVLMANHARVLGMADYLLPLVVAIVLLLAALAGFVAAHLLHRRNRQAAEHQMVELARLHAETSVRIEGLRDIFAGRQAEL